MSTYWTRDEKFCYIAHVWADKEQILEMMDLQDFNYTEMAQSIAEFIDSQPDNIDFITHIENCFDVLEREVNGAETVEWTKEYFIKYY
jgi:hypothetical protein